MTFPEKYWDLTDFLIVDVETDALFDYTTIHCVVTKDQDGVVKEFVQPLQNKQVFLELFNLLNNKKTISGHNYLLFDIKALRHFGFHIPDEKVIDTLVISRLLDYNMEGGHSLEAWGVRTGRHKKHADMEDFSVFTPEMLERCISDVELNYDIFVNKFLRFLKDPAWLPSIWLEHQVQLLCGVMHDNGIPIDKELLLSLKEEVSEKLLELDELIVAAFPPKQELLRSFTPRQTLLGTINAQDFRWFKTRTILEDRMEGGRRVIILGDARLGGGPVDLSDFLPDVPIDLYTLSHFNPGSVRQIVERMNEAGWRPVNKTKGHIDALKNRKTPKEKLDSFKQFGWKVDEENLSTLPASAPSAARSLADRLVLASRLSTIDELLGSIRDDGKIHARFAGVGAWTHRLSHSNPNSANIPTAKRTPQDSEFQSYIHTVSDRIRQAFIAPKGWRLVGTDADGIQMRIFAHLVGDERLIQALVSGKKEDGTDIHSLHKSFLGSVCATRDVAKTFIYAWLLGSGTGKTAEILSCTLTEAKTAVDNFLSSYPGLKQLKQKQIPADAKRGYFVGLDGRKVKCNNEHLMLAGYLQNGEKVIMALAGVIWMRWLEEEKIPYTIVNWVHDEWQTLVPDDDEVVKRVQHLQMKAIEKAGEILEMNCPTAGSSDSGYNWKETH